ncbi:MAG: hypothetical protein KDD53_05105, partial [Bdellovibrionales bacterium]|nr:hypothetical protein [Bdellovibrionales bacterium]
MIAPVGIAISSISSVSCFESDPLGALLGPSLLTFEGESGPFARLCSKSETDLKGLLDRSPHLERCDRVTQLAVLAASEVFSGNSKATSRWGVNFSSSRGATNFFELAVQSFLESGVVSPITSPSTTLGGISSRVAHELGLLDAASFTHSQTCSGGFQAIANGIAWILSGALDSVLCGASEACITPFTLAQMKALRVLSKDRSPYPCRPLDQGGSQPNGMALGEAAVAVVLEPLTDKNLPNSLGVIESVGFGFEPLTSPSSISPNGRHFQVAMEQALSRMQSPDSIDLVLVHAPGTAQGDAAELNAIRKVFQGNLPYLYSQKWLTGHTFAASGLLHLELALDIFKHQNLSNLPYALSFENKRPKN